MKFVRGTHWSAAQTTQKCRLKLIWAGRKHKTFLVKCRKNARKVNTPAYVPAIGKLPPVCSGLVHRPLRTFRKQSAI